MHLRLKMFLETNKKGDEVIQLFVDKFPQIPAPSRQGTNKLNNRFEENGTVHDSPKRGKFLSIICMSGSEVVVEQIGPQDRAIYHRYTSFHTVVVITMVFLVLINNKDVCQRRLLQV